MQEDSCLPDQASVHEDLADTAPLAHDDLGCPIRRDRLYQRDSMVATAKPLSGPPISPSLFRPPRTSAPERPSPKAIQASIKESATLAAAISMQWKEEVSAMRRELADLRKDLCKELRAFNNNFNTFTQHYNTWSPQGANTAAGESSGRGAGAGVGAAAGGCGTSGTNRGTGGAREKKPRVSKVSVGTQSRSKVLVRQSTADAAVNCPEEKELRKGSRRNLPKQLSMDPSILACPQSMYVESAIPLSLDPIMPWSARAVQPEALELSDVPPRGKPDPKLTDQCVLISCDMVTYEPVTDDGTVPLSSEAAVEMTAEPQITTAPQPANTDPANEHSSAEPPHLGDVKSQDLIPEREKMHLPYPVPVVTVSPPEELDYDVTSDSELPDPDIGDEPDPEAQNPSTVCSAEAGLEDPDSTEPTDLDPKPSDVPMVSTFVSVDESISSVYEAPPIDLDIVMPCNIATDNTCPFIVVSEYLDPDSPIDSDTTSPDPIVTFPDYPSDPFPEMPDSTFASSSVQTQQNTEPEFEDSEWPPLPEPLDTTPIYHADLVHFDLVMLTSLDQDDLDSVFMDAEPEPFDISLDSLSNLDLQSPVYQSDSPGSPLPVDDTAPLCHMDPTESPVSISLDPTLEYFLSHMPQDGSSVSHKAPLPQVTVTVSPPSSVSPDTSLEIDFGPTSPAPDPASPDPSQSDLQETAVPSSDQACKTPDDAIAEPLECMDSSQGYEGGLKEEKSQGSPEKSSCEEAFLWNRWQRRTQRKQPVQRSGSVELWSGRYEYNSAEITYVSLTL